MSGSGQKQIVINPLERALSTDINRLQEFAGFSLSALFQAMIDTNGGYDDGGPALTVAGLAGGAYVPNTTQGTPAYAEVVSGFVFVPTNASTACVISAGVLFMLDPDAVPSPDDSQFKNIIDPGTSSLVLTPNASGSIRIDVVECARQTPDTVLETDNRDVYNTITGTFAAASVNKVTQAQLQYRIRTGTAGSGYPGGAAGWMPIAVVSVPTGTTTWDTCTIWDVRPLLADRVKAPFNVSYDMPRGRNTNFYTFQNASGFQMSGIAEAAYANRWLGGRIARGSPGVDSSGGAELNTVDFTDTANQEASMSTSNGLKHIYLLTPFGLPRWARYIDAAVGVRVPRNPRGILLMSTVGPAHAYGVPSSAITFPAVFGFNGATTASGVHVGSVYMASTTLQKQTCSAGKVGLLTTLPPTISGTGFASSTTAFSVVENTHVPAGVRRLHCVLVCVGSTTNTNFAYMNPLVSVGLSSGPTTAGAEVSLSSQIAQNNSGGTLALTFKWEFWIELPNAYPLATPGTYTVTANVDPNSFSTGTTFSGPQLIVQGWET